VVWGGFGCFVWLFFWGWRGVFWFVWVWIGLFWGFLFVLVVVVAPRGLADCLFSFTVRISFPPSLAR